ncbi:hypothetical protein BGZ96_002405 [Linnemannia gamsii]|uniref:Uncharacterized protein n=1 Tax=Linnemannia gamsii TaxID=64522 RepID=A0ABQ7JL70_9FUNG|nr:hypothetical protein BGZ96_002405 [Linnemannia gamsii]
MTPNITSSALSSSTGAAEAVVLPLPSRTVTKRPAEVRPATRTVKRTRLINDDEDEYDIDDENDWENDDEDDDCAGEKEEEELVEGMEGYEKKLRTRDDRRFADWVAGKLNEQGVYTVLQARNTETKKKTPKAAIHR